MLHSRGMAAEPWNRVNITFPGALCRVRVPFSSSTDASVRALLVESEKALQLLQSTLLQTEVRVLYELLYILNNSSRGNKTFKGLQQVEQCFNRLKAMKLHAALQELTELCPNRIQRALSVSAGEGDVPSQAMLEWFCLKVLGGARLLSCTLGRCSRAFLLSKQQMKWEEFVILNMVITSTLSRLWVVARGVLVSLSALYQQLLELHREVASARPMPFLTDFSLPADISHFLCPSPGLLLSKKMALGPQARRHRPQQRKKLSAPGRSQAWKSNAKEDVGVAVERGESLHSDMKPFLKVFKDFTKSKSSLQKTQEDDRKHKFKERVRSSASFTQVAAQLEDMILWCGSQKMQKEKRLLTFLLLKCQRMKSLEAAGYNVQRRLQAFRQEACWASSPQGSMPKSCRRSPATRRRSRLRTRFQFLKSLKSSKVRRRRKRTSGLSGDERRRSTTYGESSQAACDSADDIDDIFASVGL